jgi:hypothetical protein
MGYISAANDTTYTQIPMTIPLDPDSLGHQVRIVIPMSDYAQYFTVPGATPDEDIQIVDRHEGWHAIDTKNSMAGINWDNLKTDQLQTIDQKLNNLDYMKLSCVAYNMESYADIGSAGDMIRNGHSIDLIDDIISVRLGYSKDAMHMSPPGLQELKKEINAMGIDKFRALNDEQANAFYDGVLDNVKLNYERLSLVYKYIQCPLDEREAFIVKNQANPDFAVAFKYINCFVTESTVEVLDVPAGGGFDVGMFITLMQVTHEVQSWDAKAELQKRAMEIDGKITPASYAKAYGSLMNDLNKMPDGTNMYDMWTFESKIVKLKNTFQEAVGNTDYVQANLDHGVDILKVEPSLKDVVKPAAVHKHHKQGKTFYYKG